MLLYNNHELRCCIKSGFACSNVRERLLSIRQAVTNVETRLNNTVILPILFYHVNSAVTGLLSQQPCNILWYFYPCRQWASRAILLYYTNVPVGTLKGAQEVLLGKITRETTFFSWSKETGKNQVDNLKKLHHAPTLCVDVVGPLVVLHISAEHSCWCLLPELLKWLVFQVCYLQVPALYLTKYQEMYTIDHSRSSVNDMVWKLGKLQSAYKELRFDVGKVLAVHKSLFFAYVWDRQWSRVHCTWDIESRLYIPQCKSDHCLSILENGCNHEGILTFTTILEFCWPVFFIEFISELYWIH